MKLWALAFLFVAVAGAAPDNEEKFPDFPGRALFLKTCGTCHGPQAVTGMSHDRAGWKDLVNEMIARGAVISGKDAKEIVNYLAKAFPKNPPRDAGPR